MSEAIQPTIQISTVAVIGAGQAGRRFALRCASAGFSVSLEDVMPAKLRAAESEFADLTGQIKSGILDLTMTVEDAVRDADIVIDFVPDELESKLEIFSLIDRMAPPRTILCTPTYALSITDLASCTYRADRCVAVRGEMTTGNMISLLHPRTVSMEVVAAVVNFFVKLGVDVITQEDNDSPMLMKNRAL